MVGVGYTSGGLPGLPPSVDHGWRCWEEVGCALGLVRCSKMNQDPAMGKGTGCRSVPPAAPTCKPSSVLLPAPPAPLLLPQTHLVPCRSRR